jgi:hypothetical protein|tara:strand:+ start:10 stop:207 length:198 start_codon:yes stop_codon:yes gene_type:complete
MEPTELGYLAIYNDKTLEIRGKGMTLYDAKQRAIRELRVPRSKQHMISIMLCEKDGKPVTHTPNF